MESLVQGQKAYDATSDVFHLHRKRVLAKSGLVVGHIKEVRMDYDKGILEGIVVSRFPRKPWYVSTGFIERVTDEAVLLKVEPIMLLKGTRVITDDGEVVGKVSEVQRKGTGNQLDALIIKHLFHRPITVKPEDIKAMGQSIMLKESWRR